MKKYKLGYTTGVFDLFHIGHLNILKRAKSYCDELLVGVTIDELVNYKNKQAVINFEERIEIVEAIKYVNYAIPQEDMDKFKAWQKYKFEVIFVGSDWKNTETWNNYEKQFSEVGVDIIYLPYTKQTSSTKLRKTLDKVLKTQNE